MQTGSERLARVKLPVVAEHYPHGFIGIDNAKLEVRSKVMLEEVPVIR